MCINFNNRLIYKIIKNQGDEDMQGFKILNPYISSQKTDGLNGGLNGGLNANRQSIITIINSQKHLQFSYSYRVSMSADV